MSDEIVFTYDAKKNPEGTWIDGVPLRDLTKAEFKSLKPHLQAAVKREAYYVAAEKAQRDAGPAVKAAESPPTKKKDDGGKEN